MRREHLIWVIFVFLFCFLLTVKPAKLTAQFSPIIPHNCPETFAQRALLLGPLSLKPMPLPQSSIVLPPNLLAKVNQIDKIEIRNRKDIERLLDVGYRLSESEDNDNSLKVALKILKKNPNNAAALQLAGYCYEKKGDFKKALECYLRANAIEPNRDGVHNGIGLSYWQLDNRNGKIALEEFEKEMRYHPTNPGPFTGRALIYRFNKEPEKAFTDYKKAIELAPDDLGNLLIVARYCEQHEVHIQEGKEFLNKAFELNPQSWRAWEIKAGFHYVAKEYDAAEKDYLHSINLKLRTTTLYELCWTYTKMGRLVEAKSIYDRADAMDPTENSCYKYYARLYLEEAGVKF